MRLFPELYIMVLLGIMPACSLSAQEKGTYVLNGYMGVEGGESFHYKLELLDSAGAYLKGYSYTFSDNKNAVKTALTAQRDPIQKTLKIQEQEIIYNHGFHSRATICLVNALLHFEEQQNTLSGPIITQTIEQGSTCSKGSISFINKQEIEALFSGPPKQEPEAKPVAAIPKQGPIRLNQEPVKQLPVSNHVPPPPVPEKITEGKDGVYDWHSDKIIFRIWDGSDVDNDRVTLLFNGKPLLENYTLNKIPKEVSLSLSGNEMDTISVIALNEGNTPPNTANISISDGSRNYQIIAYNKITKTATIRIRKK